MPRFLAFVYLLSSGLLLGAQAFFAAVAAQAAFPRETAALPQGDPARTAAADLVGKMLGALDRWTLAGSAVAVICAVLLGRQGVPGANRAAIPPLVAGVLAALSMAVVTPAIQALRAAGTTKTSAFGLLHAASSIGLLMEIALFALALWMAPRGEPLP